jgi:hypothetical protein
MTEESVVASSTVEANLPFAGANRKQISLVEIAESFAVVQQDILQIGNLTSKEKVLASQCLVALTAYMRSITKLVDVSTTVIPISLGLVSQAQIGPTGHLLLFFSDGSSEIVDLTDVANRDLMMAVVGDLLPKFEAIIMEIEASKLCKVVVEEPPKIEVPNVAPAPIISEPPPLTAVAVETTALVVEPLFNIAEPEIEPEPASAIEPQPALIEVDPTPALLAERNSQIESAALETLTILDTLGDEVFEQKPVSKYFDDWMVNLHQVILFFESNKAIGADEKFSAEYNHVFGKIEDELTTIIANEADVQVSLRTLVENRYLLNKIDEGYVAESKQLVAKGKSQIDNLMRTLQSIENEKAKIEQVKTSYRHLKEKMGRDQKITELTQKINATKKRLAFAVGTSSVGSGLTSDLDADFETQSRELTAKREAAFEVLMQNVQDLSDQLDFLKKLKPINPVKKVANQQQIFENTEKLVEAKRRLQVAEQDSSAQMERLREEHKKKKQAALGQVQSLEKNIAVKDHDNSAYVRKEAAKLLLEAVKACVERKKAQPMVKVPREAEAPP